MKLNQSQKTRLRQLLGTLSNEDEAKELKVLDAQKVKEIVGFFEQQELTHEDNVAKLLAAFDSYAKTTKKQTDQLVNSFTEFTDALGQKLDETGLAISRSYEKNRPSDLSGYFKDFGSKLAQYATASNKTADLISNLKWNASQQLRDLNGSPVNPSIAAFAVTAAYDEIELSNYDGSGNVGTVTYLQAGNIVAILSLSYDGSGNLTDVTRTK